jgi:hypothetical protein
MSILPFVMLSSCQVLLLLTERKKMARVERM